MDDFTPAQIETIYQVIAARRDMRHFSSDPLDEALMARLLQAAHCAPSVGYMQPWRFIRVRSTELRSRMLALAEAERLETAKALGERQQEFCGSRSRACANARRFSSWRCATSESSMCSGAEPCRTWDLASVACAIQNMWLAARAENVGVGWVSMFDPEGVRELLEMPPGSRPVAILCLGRVDAFYSRPMLETQGWRMRADLSTLVFEDRWGGSPPHNPESRCPMCQSPAPPR